MKLIKLAVVIAIIMIGLPFNAQEIQDSTRVDLEQLDERFILTAQHTFNENWEEYFFSIQNNTEDEYAMVVNFTLNSPCHDQRTFSLQANGKNTLKPKATFTSDPKLVLFFEGGPEKDSCRQAMENSFTFLSGITYKFVNIRNLSNSSSANGKSEPKEEEEDQEKEVAEEIAFNNVETPQVPDGSEERLAPSYEKEEGAKEKEEQETSENEDREAAVLFEEKAGDGQNAREALEKEQKEKEEHVKKKNIEKQEWELNEKKKRQQAQLELEKKEKQVHQLEELKHREKEELEKREKELKEKIEREKEEKDRLEVRKKEVREARKERELREKEKKRIERIDREKREKKEQERAFFLAKEEADRERMIRKMQEKKAKELKEKQAAWEKEREERKREKDQKQRRERDKKKKEIGRETHKSNQKEAAANITRNKNKESRKTRKKKAREKREREIKLREKESSRKKKRKAEKNEKKPERKKEKEIIASGGVIIKRKRQPVKSNSQVGSQKKASLVSLHFTAVNKPAPSYYSQPVTPLNPYNPDKKISLNTGIGLGISGTAIPAIYSEKEPVLIDEDILSKELQPKNIYTVNLDLIIKLGVEHKNFSGSLYAAPKIGVSPLFDATNFSPLHFGGEFAGGLKKIKVYVNYSGGTRNYHLESHNSQKMGSGKIRHNFSRLRKGVKLSSKPNKNFSRSHILLGIISENITVSDTYAYLHPGNNSLEFDQTSKKRKGYFLEYKKDHSFNFYVNAFPDFIYSGKIPEDTVHLGKELSEKPTDLFIEIGFIKTFDSWK